MSERQSASCQVRQHVDVRQGVTSGCQNDRDHIHDVTAKLMKKDIIDI